MMLVPLFLAMAYTARKSEASWLARYYSGGLAITLLSILGTFMRGVWGGMFCILSWFYYRFSKGRLALLLFVVVLLSQVPIFVVRFKPLMEKDDLDVAFSGRLELWTNYIIPQVKARPLLGMGYGNFPRLFHDVVGYKYRSHAWGTGPHNEYLGTALFLGIPGVIVYVWYFLNVLRFAEVAMSSKVLLTRSLATGLFGLTLAILLTALVDLPWGAHSGRVLYFALCAFTYISFHLERETDNGSGDEAWLQQTNV